ncbi:MFS transporter [Bordetella genomosp. 9]|uniref:MFS transporter n=1 Tax=Bordetella genomosp. 9 TaxID=1416803 RepID=A0A261R579_9BORD|nr:MFS transporter [Bordetella genomosp. 9]OZI20204.1 MFS transporter [Bordetella genomosp. 9]
MNYAERNAPYWKRNLVVCVFGSFTTLVSLSMLLPFLPLYVQQLGAKSADDVMRWSAIAFGATFFGTAITAPVWGRLADRYGRKPMLIRAAVGMAIVMSLIGLARGITDLVLLRLVAGLVGGYASASTVMIGTQAPPRQAGWALGVLSTGALAGSLVGPLVGGFLPGLVGIRGTFFVGGGIIAVAALATMFLIREDFDVQSHRSSTATRAAGSPRSINNLYIWTLLTTAMMVLLSNMSIEPIITIYVGELGVHHDKLAQSAGIIMACSALGSILAAPRLGAMADRVGSRPVIIGCLVATSLVLVPQAFVKEWWQLAVLRGIMGATLAGLLPSVAKLIRQSVSEGESGSALGYLQSAQFSGQVIGPLLGGAIGVHMGLPHVFFVTSALLLLCALLNYWSERRAKAGVARPAR